MTTEDKALKLLNEVSLYKCENVDTAPHKDLCTALRLAIEQHEAFRQEVSDVAEEVVQRQGKLQALLPFIIPKPKLDPLMDVAKMMGYFNTAAKHWVGDVRASLDALGFEIREKGQ